MDEDTAKIEFNLLQKSGQLSEDEETVTWTVTVNPERKDVGGWTLTDEVSGHALEGKGSISPNPTGG